MQASYGPCLLAFALAYLSLLRTAKPDDAVSVTAPVPVVAVGVCLSRSAASLFLPCDCLLVFIAASRLMGLPQSRVSKFQYATDPSHMSCMRQLLKHKLQQAHELQQMRHRFAPMTCTPTIGNMNFIAASAQPSPRPRSRLRSQ